MKKMRKELISHNVFHYIAAFFALVILIISVMGGYLYRFYYKTMYADFLKENEQHLAAIANRHENDMRITDDIVTQLGLSGEVVRFKLGEQPQKSLRLEEQLKRYTTVSQFFNLLLYHYHEDEYLYSYCTSVSEEIFLGSGFLMENVEPDRLRELLKEETPELRILPEQDSGGVWINYYLANRKKVVFLKAIPPSCEETLMFMVPDSYYDGLLFSEPQERRMDFLYHDGQMIVCRGGERVQAEELCGLLDGEPERTERISLDGGQYLLSVRRGESGILYGSLQSMDIFYEKFMSGQWGIIWIMLVCAIPAAFIIVLAADRIMRKVRRLNLLLNDEVNYDLNSIEHGIETLVMSSRESERENLPLKKTRFISDFIRGSFSDREEAVEAARRADLQIDYEQYLVVLIRSREINNENKAYSSMLEVIAQENRAEGYGVHLINNNQNLFVLFADEEEELERVLLKLLEIEKNYCQDYVMAASNYHTAFEESSKAYLEANTAFDNHLLLDNSRIIRFAEVAQKDYGSLLPENCLYRLKYAIRTGDKPGVEAVVKDICERMTGENASLYAFRMLYNDIINVLLSEWKGAKTGLDDFYNVFTLSQCLNIQDFNELLCEACGRIIDKRSGIAVQNSGVIEEAVAYMQTNFPDPELTMNALAEHLHVSSVTLAVEFKNEMDIRPSDYLVNLRMEKAKELLRNTDMLIREISVAVGYEDGHVFMRRFKKYTGMTPGQYREEQVG